MWHTGTYWFDVAVITTIFAVGNILMGHFEAHRPKWRRVLKFFVMTTAVTGGVSAPNASAINGIVASHHGSSPRIAKCSSTYARIATMSGIITVCPPSSRGLATIPLNGA